MKANKVSLNNEVLIDLTQDTAVEEDVLTGKTFHKADGSIGVGTAQLADNSWEVMFSDAGSAEINFPTLERMRQMAFYQYAHKYITKFTAPKLKYIGGQAFESANLEITELPDSIEHIGSSAFARCVWLQITKLPRNLDYLEGFVFQYCSRVNTLTFQRKPSYIATNALKNEYLTTINVPWAQGAVSGAPWGATNATINYNYTGE